MTAISWDNQVTFGVAYLGYILLTALVASSLLPQVLAGPPAARLARMRPALAWATFLVGSIHAVLVWHLRFRWDLDASMRNGLHSAFLFHLAWASLAVVALRARKGKSHPMLYLGWIIVASGTTAAPFLHAYVAWLRLPMVAVTSVGLSIVALWLFRRWRQPAGQGLASAPSR